MKPFDLTGPGRVPTPGRLQRAPPGEDPGGPAARRDIRPLWQAAAEGAAAVRPLAVAGVSPGGVLPV